MIRSWQTIALSLIFCLVAGKGAHAGDGRIEWFKLESEHFIVSYHAPLHDFAKKVAAVAERSHEAMVPEFAHEPKGKTHIVVDNLGDGSNGFASVLPRNAIRVFASPPNSKSQLGDHEDWMYALIAHEYAHILHLDIISGLPEWVNRVFGRTWAPNQVQPRWVIEGIATFEESRHSAGGRLRNTLYRYDLLTPTLEAKDRDISQMTHDPRFYPQGNVSYLYGGLFMKYIADRYGYESITRMAHFFGGNPIPYGLNKSARFATGQDFDQLFDEWRENRRDWAGLEVEAVARAGIREGRRLTFTGQGNFFPRYTRDGKHIIWRHNPGTERDYIASMPADGDALDRKVYAYVQGSGAFDVLADGDLVMERTSFFRDTYTTRELYRIDAETGRDQRLTRRERVREPAVSPDGRWIAFSRYRMGKRSLALRPLGEGGETKILWEAEGENSQALSAAWSPDGKHIAYSLWKPGGNRDIQIIEVATGKILEVTNNRASDIDPEYDPQGRYLYFASDRGGTYNIYAYRLADKQLFQVSNVVGMALDLAVSPDGKSIVYRGASPEGPDLYQMALNPESWTPAEHYIDDRPDPVMVKVEDYAISDPRPYRVEETLGPNRYDLQYDSVNQRASLSVEGDDVVGLHSFNLATTADFSRGTVNLGGRYTIDRFWPRITLAATRQVARRGGFVIDDRNTVFEQETLASTLTIGLPVLRRLRGRGQFSFAYDFDYLRMLNDPQGEPDPNTTLPRKPETDLAIAGAAVRFSYSDVLGTLFTLGGIRGKSLSLSARFNHPSLGSDVRTLDLDYNFRTFYKLPFGQTPVLSLQVFGGIRISDRARQGQFSLGGSPQQDIVAALQNTTRASGTGVLRGYEERVAVGRQRHLANLEYRQEIGNFETGAVTLPIYLRKLHFAGLMDLGNATNDRFRLRDLKPSLGISLRLDLVIGYFARGTVDIGYARGLAEGAKNEWWTLLTTSL